MSMVATTKSIAVLFFVLAPSAVSTACDQASMTAAMTPCMMSIMTASGDTCTKWNTAVCCIKDQFTSCSGFSSSSFDTTLNSMQVAMKTTVPGMSDADTCSTPSCSGGGNSGSGSGDPVPTPAPTPIAKAIETMIEFADITKFDMAQYKKDVEQETGGTGAEAVIEKLEVFLTYLVPPDSTDAALITAVATALGGIAESLVTICSTTTCHNHAGGRRLAGEVSKTVNIDAAGDTAKAADYTTKSQSSATTTALTTALGAAVTVETAPKAKMKIKTTVTSDKPKSELETSLKSGSMATKVGGTITAVTSNNLESNTSSGFKSGVMAVTSIALAALAGFV